MRANCALDLKHPALAIERDLPHACQWVASPSSKQYFYRHALAHQHLRKPKGVT
jgi:hypothetical protein